MGNLQFSDATLECLNAQEVVSRRFRFIDCFPTALGTVTLDAKSADPEPLTVTATFHYQFFVMEPLTS
jgi:hypothetical protein